MHQAREQVCGVPVLMGDIDIDKTLLDSLAECQKYAPCKKTLEAAADVDADAWLAGTREAYAEDAEDDDDDEDEFADMRGPPPTPEENRDALPSALSTTVAGDTPDCIIAILPTLEAAEAAAWIGFGGFNDCPAPHLQVAHMRRWHEKYGAVVCSVTTSVVEAFVPHPPKDAAAAEVLAEEQYLFCADIVEQGTGTTALLAATLIERPYWYFWWD